MARNHPCRDWTEDVVAQAAWIGDELDVQVHGLHGPSHIAGAAVWGDRAELD